MHYSAPHRYYSSLQTKRVYRIQEPLASGVLDKTERNSESLPENREVPVYVKTLRGLCITVNISLTSTCYELKCKIEEKGGCHPSMLVYRSSRWIPEESIFETVVLQKGNMKGIDYIACRLLPQ